MKKQLTILMIICCAPYLPAGAQEQTADTLAGRSVEASRSPSGVWSLRRCIDYAIEHNIDIRQAANQAEQSAIEVNTAKWARLPNLSGSANQSWNWGRTQTAVPDEATGDYSTVYVNTSSNNTSFSLGASIPIFTGLELPHQYSLAKLNLKAAIAEAKIIDPTKLKADVVQILSTVEMKNTRTGQIMKYTIVSESEANLREGKISSTTPIAQGLLGKKVGDKVDVKVPNGTIGLEIVSIAFN